MTPQLTKIAYYSSTVGKFYTNRGEIQKLVDEAAIGHPFRQNYSVGILAVLDSGYFVDPKTATSWMAAYLDENLTSSSEQKFDFQSYFGPQRDGIYILPKVYETKHHETVEDILVFILFLKQEGNYADELATSICSQVLIFGSDEKVVKHLKSCTGI